MGDPGRIANRIEHRPTADNHDVRSTIEPVSFDGREDVIDALGVVLDLLAAGNKVDVRNQFQVGAMLLEPAMDARHEFGLGVGDRLVDPPLHAGPACVAVEQGQEVFPVGSETVPGKTEPQELGDGEVDVQGIFGDRPGDRGHFRYSGRMEDATAACWVGDCLF